MESLPLEFTVTFSVTFFFFFTVTLLTFFLPFFTVILAVFSVTFALFEVLGFTVLFPLLFVLPAVLLLLFPLLLLLLLLLVCVRLVAVAYLVESACISPADKERLYISTSSSAPLNTASQAFTPKNTLAPVLVMIPFAMFPVCTATPSTYKVAVTVFVALPALLPSTTRATCCHLSAS